MSPSVIVVGGGVFGVTAALSLRARGWQVTLLDPGPLPHPAAASTDISKVIRMDYGADVFYMEAMERSLAGWRQWNAAWPQPLFHEIGFSLLKRSPMLPDSYEGASYALLQARGHPVERMDADQIRRRFPAWRAAGLVDGYYNPQGGWAQSGQVVAHLLQEAGRQGVVLRTGASVRGWDMEGDRLTGVQTEAGRLKADCTVLAAGAWTPAMLPELQACVWPVGQPVIHLRAPEPAAYQPPEFVTWALDIAETGWYGFPSLDDGTLKLANHGPGRRLPPTARLQMTEADEARFRQFLAEALPALAAAERVGARVCYYADSWDGDFYIDRVPGRDGLVVATGGSGHAFKFAPLLGDWIADAVEGVANSDLSRFAWRQPAGRRSEEARHAGAER